MYLYTGLKGNKKKGFIFGREPMYSRIHPPRSFLYPSPYGLSLYKYSVPSILPARVLYRSRSPFVCLNPHTFHDDCLLSVCVHTNKPGVKVIYFSKAPWMNLRGCDEAYLENYRGD